MNRVERKEIQGLPRDRIASRILVKDKLVQHVCPDQVLVHEVDRVMAVGSTAFRVPVAMLGICNLRLQPAQQIVELIIVRKTPRVGLEPIGRDLTSGTPCRIAIDAQLKRSIWSL